VDPILFEMHNRGYWSLGEKIAKAWDVGKEMKKK
jgi:hypothetical protein